MDKRDRLVFLGFGLGILGLVAYGYLNAEISFVYVAVALIVLWFFVIVSMAIAKVAQEKGRSYSTFFVLSLLLSPIIMGIIAAVISPLPGSKRYVPLVVQSVGSAASSEVDQIEKLGDLLAKGLITQVEFDDKKAKLLDRL